MSSLQDTQKGQRTEGTDGGIGNWSVCQRRPTSSLECGIYCLAFRVFVIRTPLKSHFTKALGRFRVAERSASD